MINEKDTKKIIEVLLNMLKREYKILPGLGLANQPNSYKITHRNKLKYGVVIAIDEQKDIFIIDDRRSTIEEQISTMNSEGTEYKKHIIIEHEQTDARSEAPVEIIAETCVEEYPTVIIIAMEKHAIHKTKCNEITANTELNLMDEAGNKKYKLVSCVTKDLTTGEMYAEIQDGQDMWTTAYKNKRYRFREYDKDKLRVIAIYELQK